MDPNHRDRIAFARVCSGRLARGMRLKQVRTGKLIPLHAPQFFFAREREIADEAFAGDVVGIPNHGTLRIGDTLTDGEDINFVGVPYFAPEILRRVRLDDAMKAKKLRQALAELAEEGVVQLFRPQDGGAPLVGVVGTLQLDVLQARLGAEYGVAIGFETSPYALARWVSSDDRVALQKFIGENRSAMADDVDGDPVFLATSTFMMRRAAELAPDAGVPRHQGCAGGTGGGLTSGRHSASYSSHQQQNDNDQHHQSQPAARVVAPPGAVRPGRQRAQQQDDQDDQKQRRHAGSLPAGHLVAGVAGGVLHATDSVLHPSLGLLGLALGLGLGVAGDLAPGFLHLALGLLAGAFDAILVHVRFSLEFAHGAETAAAPIWMQETQVTLR